MNIIIPLGGSGQRFSDEGYKSPKPLIKVLGKPILFWVIESLRYSKKDQLFIAYNKDLDSFRFADEIRRHSPDIRLVPITRSRGAAHTLSLCLETMSEAELEETTVSIDGDTFYENDILMRCPLGQNAICYFKDFGPPVYSYTRMEEDRVVEIKEKIKISDNANSGCYCFASGRLLKEYCDKILTTHSGEPYISSVMSQMLLEGHKIEGIEESKEYVVCLGTPNQVRIFCHQRKKDCPQRFCFDLDNTLVTHPVTYGEYNTVRPIQKNIDYVRYLKSLGHTIIIYTARRMRTHDGNTGKIVAEIGALTIETLEKLGIPYDELYFGKPHADVYIDDLGISAFENLEKHLGYYQPEEIQARKFNTIECLGSTYRKTSTAASLQGELFFYNNRPESISHLFPALVNHGNDFYEIETVQGTTFSELMVNGSLTLGHLDQLMDALGQIHNIRSSEDINIYQNYAAKLTERYNSYDYSVFPGAHSLYEELLEGLQWYENQQRGSGRLIHGDPVFSNVLLDKNNQIKLIDPRGRQGTTLTLKGDMLYDYAKVYQSLMGYDYILLGEPPSCNERLQEAFLSKLGSTIMIEDVKLLARSLFFTLIPLHDNEKCQIYFDLAKK